MANTLASFLVGIGLDYDNKGAKQAVSSLDSIRRTALQAGAAVAGAFGAKALTTDINNRTLELTRFSDVFGSTAEEVFAMGRVLEREGGTLNGFMSQMEGLERLRAGLLKGDVSWIPEGALAGLNTAPIMNASNALEAYQELARQFPTLSPQQRINVADAIGLDQASILLLSKGIDNLESEFNRIKGIRPISDEMIMNAEKYNKEWQDLKDNIGGAADALSLKFTPILNGILQSSNEVFNLWREGFSFGGIIGETSAGGRISAEASFGEDAAWLDKTIGQYVSEAVKDSEWLRALIPIGLQVSPSDFIPKMREYSEDELDAMSRDMMTRLPSFEPTVITPAQVAPLSQPVQQAESVAAQAQAQQSSIGYNYTQQRPIVNNIYLEGRMIKQVVNEAIDENAEQAVRDLRSPIDR